VRLLHALREVLAVTLDVLIDRALDKLGLLEARHQRGVADLLLGGLMNLDRGLCTHHGITRYLGTTDDSMRCWVPACEPGLATVRWKSSLPT
jgi:hypothetical protein